MHNNPSASPTLPSSATILAMAIPMALSSLAVPLIGLCDVLFVGHYGTADDLAATALGSSLFSLLYWSFQGLRMSATVEVAGDRDEVENTILRHFLLALLLGLLILVLAQPIFGFLLLVASDADGVMDRAQQYFQLRVSGIAITFMLFVWHGVIIGQGKARSSMQLSMFIALANIIACFGCVLLISDVVAAVAVGNIIAEICGLLFVYSQRAALLGDGANGCALQIKKFVSPLQIMFNMFCRTILLSGAMVLFATYATRFGAEIVAANSVILQIIAIFSGVIDGFAHTAEYYFAKLSNTGLDIRSNNRSTASKLLSLLFRKFLKVVLPLSAVFSLALWIISKTSLSLIAPDILVQQAALDYLPWLLFFSPVLALAYLLDGIFVGLGRSAEMRNTLALAIVLVFLPAFWLFTGSLGNHGQWLAFIMLMTARAAGLSWRLRALLSPST